MWNFWHSWARAIAQNSQIFSHRSGLCVQDFETEPRGEFTQTKIPRGRPKTKKETPGSTLGKLIFYKHQNCPSRLGIKFDISYITWFMFQWPELPPRHQPRSDIGMWLYIQRSAYWPICAHLCRLVSLTKSVVLSAYSLYNSSAATIEHGVWGMAVRLSPKVPSLASTRWETSRRHERKFWFRHTYRSPAGLCQIMYLILADLYEYGYWHFRQIRNRAVYLIEL